MGKKLLAGLATGAFMFGMVGVANATTVVDLYGDQDGFGIGLSHGDGANYTSIVNEADDDGFTDTWVYSTQSWSHVYDLSSLGTLTTATLEIFTLGQGLQGLTSLYVDDQLVGTLTDGDDVGPAYNYAFIDSFDLLAFSSYLDGADTLRIETLSSGDGWALDYSMLTLSDDVSSVPVPAAVWLFGSGLIGLLGYGKRKKTTTA